MTIMRTPKRMAKAMVMLLEWSITGSGTVEEMVLFILNDVPRLLGDG